MRCKIIYVQFRSPWDTQLYTLLYKYLDRVVLSLDRQAEIEHHLSAVEVLGFRILAEIPRQENRVQPWNSLGVQRTGVAGGRGRGE